ncbi:hypothetical protein ACQHIH_15240 [Xanthomonas sontii]|uniref:hypothetical protein n=1 Tax=Xanthomonas sontii TaxID=2650745 RepID=UPI003F865F02
MSAGLTGVVHENIYCISCGDFFCLRVCGQFFKVLWAYGDAVADDAIAKGWVPESLPQNATDIYERHGVDAGGVSVIFSAPSDNFLKGFSALDHSYFTSAEGAFSLVHSPAKYPQGVSGYYYRCSGGGSAC